MIQNGNATNAITGGGKEMSDFQAGYGLVGIISFLLAIVLFFIDGMLLWSVLFFSVVVILVLMRIMWNISGWVENVTRKMGDDS